VAISRVTICDKSQFRNVSIFVDTTTYCVLSLQIVPFTCVRTGSTPLASTSLSFSDLHQRVAPCKTLAKTITASGRQGLSTFGRWIQMGDFVFKIRAATGAVAAIKSRIIRA
jgi:hypothetical protein